MVDSRAFYKSEDYVMAPFYDLFNYRSSEDDLEISYDSDTNTIDMIALRFIPADNEIHVLDKEYIQATFLLKYGFLGYGETNSVDGVYFILEEDDWKHIPLYEEKKKFLENKQYNKEFQFSPDTHSKTVRETMGFMR